MAQGDAWQMGVAVPIANSSFRERKYISDEVGTAYTTGTKLYTDGSATTFVTDPSHCPTVITVGPSTHTNNEGAIETAMLGVYGGSVYQHASYLTLRDDLTYDYEDGDPITLLGNVTPAGWTLSGAGDLRTFHINFTDPDWGYDDLYYALGLQSSGDTAPFFLQDVPNYVPPPSTYIRVGLHCKVAEVTGDLGVYLKIYEGVPGDGAAKIGESLLAIATQDWTAESYVCGATNSNPDLITGLEIQLMLNGTLGATGYGTARFDSLWAEHAKDTNYNSGNTNVNSGYYEFAEYPTATTINYSQYNPLKTLRLANGSSVNYDPTGSNDQFYKHTVSANFDNVSTAFREVMQVFQRWQDRGNQLNLHTHLDGLPVAITGKMKFIRGANVTKSLWDLSKSSFTLVFEES